MGKPANYVFFSHQIDRFIFRQIGARTYPDLAKAIEFAFNQISLNDIRNWFTHLFSGSDRLGRKIFLAL